MKLLAAAIAGLLLLAARPAAADIHGWEVALTGGTTAPLDFELGFTAESPQRIRLSTSVGVLPHAYAGEIDDFLVDVGAFDRATGDLVTDSLSSSAVWRTMIGYRPWRARGFYAMAGYALIAFGGCSTASEAIEAATGKPLPPSERGATRSFTVDSELHTLDVEVGWRWHVEPRLLVQVAVGGMFTVGASTEISADYTPRDAAATAGYERQGADYLDHIYTTYVFSPTLIVTAGYRL
jgi:hypothetical protein